MHKSPPSSLKILGEGAFGKVFSLPNPSDNNNLMAVKVTGSNKRGVSSPIELYIMKHLNHPNITHSDNITLDTGGAKIYTDIAISNLKTYMEDNPNLPLKIRIKFMRELSSAIQHLHSLGIIHADIKPSNVLVFKKNDDLFVKITDFSISILLGENRSITSNAYTMIYRPPEVARNLRWSFAADMWALGLTFYEIIYGTPLINPKIIKDEITLKSCHENLSNSLISPDEIPEVDMINFSKNWADSENVEINDLILSLIQVNPDLRLTSNECLLHDVINIQTLYKSAILIPNSEEGAPFDKVVSHEILSKIKDDPFEKQLSLQLYKNYFTVSLFVCVLICYKLTTGNIPSWIQERITGEVIIEEVDFINRVHFKLLSRVER